MGVSGVGKTTVGRLLADREGWPFLDAGASRAPAAQGKALRGEGLTDAARESWVQAVRGRIDALVAGDESGVFACSALKAAYRQRRDAGPEVRFVYLKGTFEMSEQRL